MLPNWGFRTTVKATHSDNTVSLKLSMDSQSNTNQISYANFIEQNVPELKSGFKYWLKPTLFNGTLQTLTTFKGDFKDKFKVYYGREIISISEEQSKHEDYDQLAPGEFTLDYVVEPPVEELSHEFFAQKQKETLPEGYPRLMSRCRYYSQEELSEHVYSVWAQDEEPIVIIIPGLAGGIQEAPIRAMCEEFHNRKVHTVVYNTRGCSRSKITTPNLFTGLMTDDLKYIINHLKDRYPGRHIHLVGFSFGGLIMSNYLAFEGKNSKVVSACSISSPWDLLESNTHINASFSGKYLFQPAIVHFLLTWTKNNMPVLDGMYPFSWDRYHEAKGSVKTSEDFDDIFTCHAAGFPSARSYYYAASPSLRILKIKTPMLILNTEDDPMISTDYPYKEVMKNPYLYMATSDLGGHYSSILPNGDFWFKGVVGKFINSWHDIKENQYDDHGFDIKQTKYSQNINLYA